MPRQRKAQPVTTGSNHDVEAVDATVEAQADIATVTPSAALGETADAPASEVAASEPAADPASEQDDIDLDLPDAPPPDAPPPEALPALVQALLFVSDGPVEARTLSRALGVTTRSVTHALEVLREQLRETGVRLQLGPDGAQLVTTPEAAAYVEAFLGLEQNRRLSNAALETLAIIAYRQPVTRATIETIRGVSSDGAMQTLRARGLIEDAGRAQGPGRPTLFVTTRRFLEHFGLESPRDLPELGDYELPPPDASLPMEGLTGGDLPGSGRHEDAGANVESTESEVASALADLAAAARSLIEGPERRSNAGGLLLPGARTLELPAAPAQAPATVEPLLPPTDRGLPPSK